MSSAYLVVVLKSGLSTVTGLQRLFYFHIQAILFQPEDASSLLRGEAGLNLSVQIFTRFLCPLLSYEDLLSDLRGSNGRIIKRK